jgi:hypothetical protein
MVISVKKVTEYLKELKLHDLVKENENGSFKLTDKSKHLIAKNFVDAQEDDPNATPQEWQAEALILTVLEMGYIHDDSIEDLVAVLNTLVPPECWTVRVK